MNNQFSVFTLKKEASDSLKELLHQTTYGTNGACYRHLDTLERIEELDNPLHLSLERNKKVLANITFCRRNQDWYIRFFSFDSIFRSNGSTKKRKGNSSLKTELQNFFDRGLNEGYEGEKIDRFYAYIEPHNSRSIQFSEQFGFNKVSTIITQTFSRIKPRISDKYVSDLKWDEVKFFMRDNYENHQYYFESYLEKGPFVGLRSEDGKLIACCKLNFATWVIEQLPGKNGKVLTKLIPYIPILNRLINPKKHTFIAPEAVCVIDKNPALLQELFESILHNNSKTLILWWIDINEPLLNYTKSKVKWGLLHKIIGVTKVNVMAKSNQELNKNLHFVSAKDMI